MNVLINSKVEASTLTKENFWDGMQGKYPHAMKFFCDWIDGYKKRVNWAELFNAVYEKAPKYHELPVAMQVGIFIEFGAEKYHDPDLAEMFKDFPEAINEQLQQIQEQLVSGKQPAS